MNWEDDLILAANALCEAARSNDVEGIALVWHQLDEAQKLVMVGTLAKAWTNTEWR